MPVQRRKKQSVQRLRQKLRELHPRHDLVRFVHRLKDLLHAVFVHSSTDQSSAAAAQAAAAASGSATQPPTRLAHKHHHRFDTPLPPPRQTPPGYQSIRCVTPSEHEEGLHDDPPPGVPYHPYRPFRSYEDFRQAEEQYNRREQQAIEELREARRRASTGLSYERLVSNW